MFDKALNTSHSSSVKKCSLSARMTDTGTEKWRLFKVNPNTTNTPIRYLSNNLLSKSVSTMVTLVEKGLKVKALQAFIANSKHVQQVFLCDYCWDSKSFYIKGL